MKKFLLNIIIIIIIIMLLNIRYDNDDITKPYAHGIEYQHPFRIEDGVVILEDFRNDNDRIYP